MTDPATIARLEKQLSPTESRYQLIHPVDLASLLADARLVAALRAEADRLRDALAGVMKFAQPYRGMFCSTECLGQCSQCKALAAARLELEAQQRKTAPRPSE